MTRLQEYEIYHRHVVEECAELIGEEHREFYNQRTYFDEFERGIHPRQVAGEQIQNLRASTADDPKLNFTATQLPLI